MTSPDHARTVLPTGAKTCPGNKPGTDPVHPERTAPTTGNASNLLTDATSAGTEIPTADPSTASKLSNGAEMFRAALSDAWTVTEVARVVSVAHRGRLAVRIAASDVTPELVEHHRRWLSAVSL